MLTRYAGRWISEEGHSVKGLMFPALRLSLRLIKGELRQIQPLAEGVEVEKHFAGISGLPEPPSAYIKTHYSVLSAVLCCIEPLIHSLGAHYSEQRIRYG